MSIRLPGFVLFDDCKAQHDGGWSTVRARGKRFAVDLAEAVGDAPLTRAADDEIMILFPKDGGQIDFGGATHEVPQRSVVIVPAGQSMLRASQGTRAIIVSPIRGAGIDADVVNGSDYGPGDEGIIDVGPATPRADSGGLQIVEIDRITPPAGKPRLKMVRSATMSINWIEYEGVRDRSTLSPHSHDDFEQGSLAIEGSFIHHLRVPWGPNADDWREDQHLAAPPRSLCIVPPRVIHTTEGVGGGRHALLDIFAPARADFIEKGWMANASAYRP